METYLVAMGNSKGTVITIYVWDNRRSEVSYMDMCSTTIERVAMEKAHSK